MSQQVAFDGLCAFLQAFPGLPDVAWEGGAPYAPQNGRRYLSVQLSGYSRTPIGFGADSGSIESGLFQVAVKSPADGGRRHAGQLADALVAYFRRGTTLALSTNQTLNVENASAQPAIVAGDWLTVPVVVQWTMTDP